ncbi:MAG: hypothetical protein JXR25_17190 [Pontiellaceae bacterium]|nr:hypothetical protein [Pontiellaceae bacterium]
MTKSKFLKSSIVAGVFSLAVVSSSVADLASAAGLLAEIEAKSVAAKAMIAAAGLKGDVDQLAAAKKSSDAIDVVCAAARKAYAAIELAVKNGDAESAASAEENMKDALLLLSGAMSGKIPEGLAEKMRAEQGQAKASGKTAGNPPNINDVPWQSQGLRSFYEQAFGNFWNASSFGSGSVFGDSDATPE